MVLLVLHWVAVGVALYALVDALVRPRAAWTYAGVRRGMWLAILAVATAVSLLFFVLGILTAAAVVAALVYLLEYRPKLRAFPGRPRRNRLPSGPSPWS